MVILGGFPPGGGGGGRNRVAGVERVEVVYNYGALSWGEGAVPYEVDSYVTFEKCTIMVFHFEGLFLDKSCESS